MLKKYWAKIKKFGVWKSLLIVVLVPNIVYWGAVRPVQVRLEYRQFQQAEQEIEALSQQITETVDQNGEFSRSCGYASRKFSKGPRGCSVSYSIEKRDLSLEEVNGFLKRAAALISSRPLLAYGASVDSFADEEGTQTINQVIETNTNLFCSTVYQLSVPNDDNLRNLKLSIGCQKSALAEYYPVTD